MTAFGLSCLTQREEVVVGTGGGGLTGERRRAEDERSERDGPARSRHSAVSLPDT